MFDSKIADFFQKMNDGQYSINIFDLNKVTKIIYGVSIDLALIENNTETKFFVDGTLSEEDVLSVKDAILNESAEKDIYKLIFNDISNRGCIPKGLYIVKANW